MTQDNGPGALVSEPKETLEHSVNAATSTSGDAATVGDNAQRSVPGDASDAAGVQQGRERAVTDEALPPTGAQEKTNGSERASPTLSEFRGEGTRHASSRIANLRAAFERHRDAGNGGGGGVEGAGGGVGVVVIKRLEKKRSTSSNLNLYDAGGAQRAKDAELARLKDQQEKETELRQAYEEKCAGLEDKCAGLEDMCARLEGTVDELQAQLARSREEMQAEVERRCQGVLQDKIRVQEEANDVRRQLLELKRNVSSTARVEYVADSTFARDMHHLHFDVQNWVVNHFRRVKTERAPQEMCGLLESIAEPTHAAYLRPVLEGFDSATKLAVLQTVTVSYVMEIFEEQLLFGMPPTHDWRRGVKKAAETLSTLLPSPLFNKWRSLTLESIKQNVNFDESIDSACHSMSEMICITLSTLTDTEESAARASSLSIIIKRIITLAHLFRVQRAHYEFALPQPGCPFDPALMEDASREEESPLGSSIRCATFPSVVKRGDENGDNEQLSSVIVKARVLCSA